MMPGPEGLTGVDLDRNPAAGKLAAVMAAVHEEAPGYDRREGLQSLGDPVRLGYEIDGERGCERVAAKTVAKLCRDRLGISSFKIGIDRPEPIRALVERDCNAIFAVVALEEIRDAPRLRQSGDEGGLPAHPCSTEWMASHRRS